MENKKDVISIHGARVHNLKNIDLDIPRNKLVVFTGKSGSGKSSLAFDTIHAEGQRRYLETFNAYARQFLGRLNKPKVEQIKGKTVVEVSQHGGRYGKTSDNTTSGEGDIENGDGISHRKEGGLKLEFNWERQPNNTYKVFANLV